MNSNNIITALFVVLVIVVIAYGIIAGKVKEWLKWGVFVAEQELGSGTGEAKLHKAYDMFIEKYPAIASVLPFFIFRKWVDLALKWLRKQLETNDNIKQLIEGSNNG